MSAPSFAQQLAFHRAAIASLLPLISIYDRCGLRKSAATLRDRVAACESCIRAIERRRILERLGVSHG